MVMMDGWMDVQVLDEAGEMAKQYDFKAVEQPLYKSVLVVVVVVVVVVLWHASAAVEWV